MMTPSQTIPAAERAARLRELEQRVSAMATAISHALSELLQTSNGVDEQALARMEERLARVIDRVETLEGRVGEVAGGATGGLSELLQATDGLGQGLKAQARALAELEQRLHQVSAHQAEWRAGLEAERKARSRGREDSASLDQRLEKLAERLDGLEVRVGEVAVGVTGGLSELLQATDGLGQGLKQQARLVAELQRRMHESLSHAELERQALEERIEMLERPATE